MADKFQVVWIDDATVRITILQVGENSIGNIISSDKNSQSVLIREAAVINLTSDNKITITPCDGISCYVKSCGASRWRSVGQNWATPLKISDTCFLFPVRIWLKILPNMEDVDDLTSLKRKLSDIIDDEPQDKRCRSEAAYEVEPVKSISCNNNHEPLDAEDDFTEGFNEEVTKESEDLSRLINKNGMVTILSESTKLDIGENDSELLPSSPLSITNQDEEQNSGTDSESPNSLLCSTSQNNKEEDVEADNKTSILNPKENNAASELVNENQNENEETTNSDTDTSNQPSTTNNQSIPREKCEYGDICYRQNQQHKDKFSHPGNTDYDQVDSRPECVYGKNCYRKNQQHKLDYKHTQQNQSRRQRAPRTDSLINLSDLDEYSDESVDESEYEPSFIDDDSEIEEFESDYFEE